MDRETSKHNYKMTIAYDGTCYGGWQVQPNATTIQELLQKAIKIIIKEDVSVIGSGRTDAGVHALAQTAHFKSSAPITLQRFLASMNGLLPLDIRVIDIEEVPLDFHARYSAQSKCYHYHMTLNRVQLPFHRLYSWHVRHRFDVEKLHQAAELFVGEHDFTSFANEAHAGSAAKNPIRNLYRADVIEEDGGIRIEFEANGFLYKMVRNIVGTLHEVSVGKITLDDIPKIFEARDRRKAGKAAPAHGLFLAYVNY